MSARKPLVLDGTGQIQQLQIGDRCDIPLEDRVDELEQRLNLLISFLLEQDIEVPDELLTN